jgi:hypothetical protein
MRAQALRDATIGHTVQTGRPDTVWWRRHSGRYVTVSSPKAMYISGGEGSSHSNHDPASNSGAWWLDRLIAGQANLLL